MSTNMVKRFKVEEKPHDLYPSRTKNNQFYYDIIGTLDVIAPTKTIILDPSEVPTKKLVYFTTYLRTLARKYKKEYKVEVTEKDKRVYVWKR